MRDVIVERALPVVEALPALDAALRQVLVDKYAGCSANRGRIIVHLVNNASLADENTAVTTVLNHDMDERTAEQVAEANAVTKVAAASTAAGNIPGWATWSEAEATGWITNNVTDLASARTALLALTRMVVALRDATWPNLAD